MQTRSLFRHALATYLLCGALAAAWSQPTPIPNDPTAGDAVAAQVAALTHVASRPSELKFGGVGVLWLTGIPDRWTVSSFEGVKRWVARGHVAWVDVALATRIGVADATAGGTDEAIVAPGAEAHPLNDGVKHVMCLDTFKYMRGLPTGAQAIQTLWNRANHVVVAIWPLGKGVIVFRPLARPDRITWMAKGERRWIEPDIADGGRFLYNLNTLTLATLENAGSLPAGRRVRERPGN